MNTIDKLLQKRKLKPEEMTSEEKETLNNWKKILSEGKITVDKILLFCDNQIGMIEMKFKDLDNSKEKIERLVLLHSVYSSLRNLINSPQKEKENLEQYLTSLF